MKFTSTLLTAALLLAPLSAIPTDAAALAQVTTPVTEAPAAKSKDEPAKGQGVEDPKATKKSTDEAGQRPAESTAEQRWKNKSEDERRVLLERYEQLRRLSPEDREALHQRARELADQRRDLESELDPGTRRNLDDLPPHERARILREHQVAERRRAGEELRESLDQGPREMVEDLVDHRGGPPRPFHEKRDELRGVLSDKVVKRFGELGQLSPEEQQRLLKLPEPERIHETLVIKRNRILEGVTKTGLPEGVTDQQWQSMLEEPSVVRFLKLARKRGFDQHLGLGRLDKHEPGGRKGPGGPDSERGPRGGPEGVPGRGPGGGPGSLDEGRPGKESAGSGRRGSEDTAQDKGFRELADLLRPTLDDRLATSELPFAERRRVMSDRLRQRAAAFLLDHAILSNEERQALKELEEEAYVEYLVELVHERRGLGSRGSKDSSKREKPDREKPDREKPDREKPDREKPDRGQKGLPRR